MHNTFRSCRRSLPGAAACRSLLLLPLFLAAVSGWAQSSRPGMGATPYADAGGTGVTFRVWAPNATNVAVPGSFNGWNTAAHYLTQEGTSGVWSRDIPGVTAGAQYKFHLNGSIWKKDPRARLSQWSGSGGNNIVYNQATFNWMGDGRLPVNQSDLVIYELHVGAFYDPTANGFPGTFANAVSKLDHLVDLGVNAVQLMPVMEFPTDFSWGYNLAEPYAVENVGYGGPDGLKNFVKEAHARGIRVLLDVVHNHYGPSDLDLWGFDNGATPGIYFYSGALGVTGWGDTRPNYSLEGVRSYIIDSFKMWMDDYHVDGFRWDSVGTMRFYSGGSVPGADTLIQAINNTEIRANRPGVISIAEDEAYGQGFHGEWDRGFGDFLIGLAVAANDTDRNMFSLWNNINAQSGFFRTTYTESHDLTGDLNGPYNQRLPYRIQPADPDGYYARKRSMLAAAVVLTMPAMPMLFMGQEMLEDEQFADGNPLDWTHATTYAGVVNFYRDLVHLRRNLDGVSLGLTGPSMTQQHLNNTDKVLAYHRWGAGANDQVMVIMNWSGSTWNNYSLSFPENGTWYVNLNSDWTRYGSDFGNVGGSVIQVSGNSGTVGLGPYSVLVLSRQAHPGLDADNDGLLNGWEQTYFSDPLVASASADNDGDGLNNLGEQGAGTHPTNPASVLRLLSIVRTGSNLTLTWQGGTSVRQVVQKAISAGGPWANLYTNNAPTQITNTVVLAGPEAEAYFRVSAGP
ncbi:MAG: alpha-amylase family glycosyl hydrolase [Verrucomicrobia bacterium]|jgi:1,4-alpha-glucan branching enzyme|nr:alpha-amylase family glycosyl hydrolase [Verrucomicrobiota bacterium]